MPAMTTTLTATLRTNQGPIVIRLLPDHAPKTVRNFVDLAQGGREWTDPRTGRATTGRLYDGTIFHRVIPNFMIQGGDPLGTGTNGSQFFITTVPTPHLNRRHTIFGEVIQGQEVVDRISRTATDGRDRPLKDVVLESVEIEGADGVQEDTA